MNAAPLHGRGMDPLLALMPVACIRCREKSGGQTAWPYVKIRGFAWRRIGDPVRQGIRTSMSPRHGGNHVRRSQPSGPSRVDPPGLGLMMKEVKRTLGNIDFEHAIELEQVDRSAAAEDLKQHIRDKLRDAHRERRQPYVDLLNRLWMQQRGQSFAA
ncbi:hypothetical protein [Microvirga yunnanensis]|uniref:hypothetical protein n=2 Tax=Microvirga yunnanensis TaxID=2953740 RepID=UPI0021C97ADC|nr:hypothetical protein [Microvirga sp. HBU67655]